MAGIGLLHMVASPIVSHTDGSAIVYGTGFLIGPGVEANMTFNSNDNPDIGDDEIIDNDNGINGYSGTIENNFLTEEVAAKLYGWAGAGTAQSPYAITDAASPEHGFGYVKKCLNKGVYKYRAFWMLRAQFQLGSYLNGRTKQRQIEWQHDVSNITGMGAYVDASGNQHYVIPRTFDTYTEAETWLDNMAGISPVITT